MAEEPSLPVLPPNGPSKKTVYGRSSPRKNTRFHSSSHFSSDPPLFSSDDDPGLDNYADPHRRYKRKYRVGPYAHQHPLTITSNNEDGGSQRRLQRHVDSAVFMASDGTEDETDIEFLKSSKALTNHITLVARPSRLQNRALPPRELSVEDQTRRDIEDWLENGNEIIDLSYRHLQSLSNSAIRPLASFSPLAARMQSGGSQHAADPTLKIYLAQNCLTSVPTEVFNLEHLSVLSLRNNEITELPEAIERLTGLKELNIANNSLRWLPYTLLKLPQFAPQLTTLHLHPNKFLAPRNLPIAGVECNLQLQLGANWEAKRYRRSYVRFMDSGGRLLKGPGLNSSTSLKNPLPPNPQFYLLDAEDDDVPTPPAKSARTYVPSLEEMCMKAWAKTPETMPGKHDAIMPSQRLQSLLVDAKNTQELEGGLRKCTVCSREYVTPRTEWFEWWAIYSHEDGPPEMSGGDYRYLDLAQATVPLIRRGCSWRCLPQ